MSFKTNKNMTKVTTCYLTELRVVGFEHLTFRRPNDKLNEQT